VKIKIDHQSGQYRAELFEELVGRLLVAVFKGSAVIHGFILPKTSPHSSLSLDFGIFAEDRLLAVAEAKASYTDSASFGINKTFRRVKDAFSRLPTEMKPKEVIIALASELPAASAYELQAAREFFSASDAELKVWDAKKLSQLLGEHLKLTIHSFSISNLEKALGISRTDDSGTGVPTSHAVQGAEPDDRVPVVAGEHEDVVVLCADFCSYTKFVLASGGDKDLIARCWGVFTERRAG
jgi:hypothetical protein